LNIKESDFYFSESAIDLNHNPFVVGNCLSDGICANYGIVSNYLILIIPAEIDPEDTRVLDKYFIVG